MKYLFIFFSILLFIAKNVFAQNYFDYTAPLMVPFDGYFKSFIKFNFGEGVKPDRFLIKPITDKGNIKIYNKKSNMWVGSDEFWTNMPDLSEETGLYLDFAHNKSINLSFEIMDKFLNKIYTTPKHLIWTYYSYKGYLTKLNDNILK